MDTKKAIEQLRKKYGKDLTSNIDFARRRGTETAGLYYKGEHIGSVPVKEIFDHAKDNYKTSYGVKHRGLKTVEAIVRRKIEGK